MMYGSSKKGVIEKDSMTQQETSKMIEEKYPNNLIASLQNILDKRKNNGKLRVLSSSQHLTDFSSNDYLGLSRCTLLQENIRNSKDNNDFIGSTGSRLLTGNNSLYVDVESKLASFHEGESALIFNSGYDANLGIFSSLPQANDIVLFDELIHNSVRVGIQHSRGKSASFKHNDVGHLRELLIKSREELHFTHVFVAVESVYSMDGDKSPLIEIQTLCEEMGASLIVDEAHSTGIHGERGQGLVTEYNLQKRIFCRMHTFGKALGVHGAVVIGPEVLKSYLLNYARSIVYTTSLPAHSLVSIKCAYELVSSEVGSERRRKLTTLVSYFANKTKDIHELKVLPSTTAIQGILLPGNENVIKAAKYLRDHGLAVFPIRSPTVPEGKERLRIIIHAHNTEDDIDRLINCLKKIVNSSRL